MEFTYEGLVRYGFGFQNPNHTAALFAALLPILWGIRTALAGRKTRLLSIPFELALYLFIVLTYSRAGLVALLAGASAFYFALSGFKSDAFIGRVKLAFKSPVAWISFAIFITAALCAGVFKRYFSWLLSHDSSVTNRLDLWSGAMRMVSENPQGVGLGESGRIYTLFYQPEGVNLAYRTLVNSFLTFVAEQGLLISGIALFLGFLTVSIGVAHARRADGRGRIVLASCLGVLASLFVSGTLSTCLDLGELLKLLHGAGDLNAAMQSSILALGALAFLAMIAACFRSGYPQFKVPFMVSLVLSLFGAMLFCAGCIATSRNAKESHEIFMDGKGAKWLLISNGDAKSRAAIFPDEKVLGVRKTMEILKQEFPESSLAVPLDQTSTMPPSCDMAVLCGGCAKRFGEFKDCDVAVFRPISLPTFEKAPGTLKRVILDPSDEFGVNSAWRFNDKPASK